MDVAQCQPGQHWVGDNGAELSLGITLAQDGRLFAVLYLTADDTR